MQDKTTTAAFAPQVPRAESAVWRHTRTIVALMLREMTSKYGRSPGGYVWAFLEPLGMIIIMAYAFALIMRSPSLGNSFILFYATGYLPFSMFGKVSRMTMTALNYSRNLLSYPAVSWFDAVTARALLNFLTEALVSYMILAGVLLLVDSKVVLSFAPIFQSFLMAALLGLGVGLINCVFGGFVPVWQTIWAVATRPLFIASAVIYIYSDLPRGAQEVIWYNPLVHVTGMARSGFYPMYEPLYVSGTYVTMIALALTALGALLLRRHHREIISRR